MKKQDLIKLLDELFIAIGFKQKGNNWVLNGHELSKLINLQKSNYSNSFYINYGYIIKGLELTSGWHIDYRLGSEDKDEMKWITDLLDLENDISTELRLAELKKLITNKIVAQMQEMNARTDLLNHLKKRPHLYDIPLDVKRFFNLPE